MTSPSREAADVPRDAVDKIGAFGRGENPVQEVRLHDAGHTSLLERAAGQQVRRIGRLEAQHMHGDGLGDDREVGVLEEDVVTVHRRAVDEFQPLRPELALEAWFGLRADFLPGVAQVAQRAVPGGALPAEFAYDGFRLGVQVVADGHGGAKPGQQIARIGGICRIGPKFA